MASTSRAATDVDAHGVLYPRYVSIARTNERTNERAAVTTNLFFANLIWIECVNERTND